MKEAKDLCTNSCLPFDWTDKTGNLRFRMNNDYLFRALMQENNDVLILLLSCLLNAETDSFRTEIMNPIVLGDAIQDKDFILDARILMNNEKIVNVEMQLWTQSFWKERSLSYLCRIFDNLKEGEPYSKVKRSIHIGIIDFVLKDEVPEFYSKHYFMNPRTQKIFSDKLQLNVLSLPYVDLATDEDKTNGVLMWAKFFNARTWEDLRMLVQDYPVMEKTVAAAWKLTEDEKIRQQIEMREEAIRIRISEAEEREMLAKEKNELIKDNEELAKNNEELAKNNEELAKDNEELAKDNEELAKDNEELAKDNEELAKDKEKLTKDNKELQSSNLELQNKNNQLLEENLAQANLIKELKQKLALLDAEK